MELSIIIVNWNSHILLENCIRSVKKSKIESEYEILVLDNGSYDGCSGMLKNNYPDVIFIQLDKNVGFARANNIGFKHSKGQLILFLNPDTIIIGEAINQLVQKIKVLDMVGILGCRVLNSDFSAQKSCIQRFPNIANQVLDSELLNSLFYNSRLWGISPLYSKDLSPVKVEVISGACMMVKRLVFEHIGGFSEDYFMYAEDVDICYKSKIYGYKNYYLPLAEIIHLGGGSSSGNSEFATVVNRESLKRYFQKFHGKLTAVMYSIAVLGSAMFRLTLYSISTKLILSSRARLKIKTGIKKQLAIIKWCIIDGYYSKFVKN
jgi:GT2 family glycosyltransferase